MAEMMRPGVVHHADLEDPDAWAQWERGDIPGWRMKCECGAIVEHYRGGREPACRCGASYNTFGQRLRDDWAGNPSNWDDEIGDLEGFEIQHAGDW